MKKIEELADLGWCLWVSKPLPNQFQMQAISYDMHEPWFRGEGPEFESLLEEIYAKVTSAGGVQ